MYVSIPLPPLSLSLSLSPLFFWIYPNLAKRERIRQLIRHWFMTWSVLLIVRGPRVMSATLAYPCAEQSGAARLVNSARWTNPAKSLSHRSVVSDRRNATWFTANARRPTCRTCSSWFPSVRWPWPVRITCWWRAVASVSREIRRAAPRWTRRQPCRASNLHHAVPSKPQSHTHPAPPVVGMTTMELATNSPRPIWTSGHFSVRKPLGEYRSPWMAPATAISMWLDYYFSREIRREPVDSSKRLLAKDKGPSFRNCEI